MPSYFTLTRGDLVNHYKFDPNADPQYALFNITKDRYCIQTSTEYYLDVSTDIDFKIFTEDGKWHVFWKAWQRIEISDSRKT